MGPGAVRQRPPPIEGCAGGLTSRSGAGEAGPLTSEAKLDLSGGALWGCWMG